MESSNLNQFDIFDIYQRYCDIKSGNKYANSREALAQLLKMVESGVQRRDLIFVELSKLMAQLNFMVDSFEFTRFYDFVFFVCRQNGQKNISVCDAVAAWSLVLAGRFRLLNQWCEFVEKNHKHNISEDTWQQVLAFSRCVHEDLEGYDPKGAWPVLIDDFVEHMYSSPATNLDIPSHATDHAVILYLMAGRASYVASVSRISRSNSCSSLILGHNCDPEAEPCVSDNYLPGLNIFSGLKRKSVNICLQEDISEPIFSNSKIVKRSSNCKIGRASFIDKPTNCEDSPPENDADDSMETVKSSTPLEVSSNCQCTIERSLSKGFAGLLSTGSSLQIDKSSVSSA